MTMLSAVSQLITSPKQKSSQEFQGFVFSEITVSESRGDLYQQCIMGKALNNTHYITWSDTLWKLSRFTISRKTPISESAHGGGIYSKTKHNSKFNVFNVYYFICACY